MLVVCVTVVLGLLSVGSSQAAPSTSEELLRSLEQRSLFQTLGKWVSISESSDRPSWELMQMLSHSAWIGLVCLLVPRTTPLTSPSSLTSEEHVSGSSLT